MLAQKDISKTIYWSLVRPGIYTKMLLAKHKIRDTLQVFVCTHRTHAVGTARKLVPTKRILKL